MGKTRDLFRKIRDTKGIFHAKMGSIKDRYGMELTEAEDVKKRWQEYTEELYKKQGSRPSAKKEMKKAKWLSEEALQIAVKRRDAQGKGEKERYPFECRVPKNSKER